MKFNFEDTLKSLNQLVALQKQWNLTSRQDSGKKNLTFQILVHLNNHWHSHVESIDRLRERDREREIEREGGRERD